MKASFIERDNRLIDKYGHLLDKAKHFTNESHLNQLEENKMAILMDNAVRATCTEMGVDYNSFDLSKIEETAQTGTSSIAFMVKTKMAMIGQVYPNMMSREIVSLQPIPQPTYKIFYNDFKREDDSSLATGIHTGRNYANNVEYDPDDPTAVKAITMEITSEDVSATTKKLKGSVTIEVEQDLMAYHGMAAMSLITGNMGAELTREWDRTIIADLFAGATGGIAYFNKTQPSGLTYEDRRYWMETLHERFVDVDTQIFKKRFRKTNYIVIPADEAGMLEKMVGFVPDDTMTVDRKVLKTGGRYFAGVLKNRWRIYVDPFIEGEILLGYNNPGDWTETSYVFSPYEMAYLSPEVTNPHTFVKTRAVMSRAARKLVIGDLLGKVILTTS